MTHFQQITNFTFPKISFPPSITAISKYSLCRGKCYIISFCLVLKKDT